MKTLILALIGLALSVWVALQVVDDSGYILIGYQQWTIEGSLALFLCVNLVVFGVVYLLLRMLSRMLGTPEQIRGWQARRGSQKARKALTHGLVELSEGNWRQAERDLVRFAGKSETPLLNYLAAARSAQQQDAHERRDHYLTLAHESMPEADVAVSLTQAELQLDHAQLEQALATLKHLREIAPRHTHVLKLLKELYLRLEDWPELDNLMPALKKRKVIAPEEQQKLLLRIHQHKLAQAALSEDLKQLPLIWNKVPAALRADQEMVTIYVNHLMNRGANEQVEHLLRDSINQQWSPDLVELYGRIEVDDSIRQLNAAEAWLKRHSQDASLLFTLGRLCLRNKLWGKARSYLEASIGIEPTAEAYCELGALLETMEDNEQAMNCFKAGLSLSTQTVLPVLPQGASLPAITQQSDDVDAAQPEAEQPKLEAAAGNS